LGIAQLLRENTPKRNIKLVLIGIDEVKTIELAKKHGIASNVELLGILNYKACREVMLKSDVLTVIEAPCEEGIFLPSKFVDYVEAGRPILAISPKSSTLNDILSSKGGGIAVDRNSADEIYKSLCDLYSSWELGVLDAKYSSSCLYHIFSSETIVAKYEEIFNKLGDPQIE
jgi:glycosyltransferase involved in cell wall biosynthesis